MIAFLCTGCQKQLSANEALAGKKVKCRACGQMTVIPPSAGGGIAEMRTLAPSGEIEGTQAGAAADLGHDSSLTEFLAPPQGKDELGWLGGFRILKILGHGGMGVVFQGEDPKLGRQVAIKAMLPHLAGSKAGQERFLREARAAAVLEHDHIVPILQVGEDRGVPFLVMPFLKGEPLDERLRHDKALPIAEVLRIGREIAEGLAAAHERGLIHRDIKLANIWLEDRGDKRPACPPDAQRPSEPLGATRGRVRILDFGLARDAADKSHLTQQGAIIGTPAYMAPEQAGGANVDARCDLWSLGVVLYRLCAGRLPFVGSDMVSTLMAVATDQAPPPAQVNAAVPAGLSDLVMKLLQKRPARRPGSARAVVAALETLERELTIPDGKNNAAVPGSPFADLTEPAAAPPSPPKPAGKPVAAAARGRKPPRRQILVLAGAGAALLLLLGGIVLFWPTANGTVRIESNDPNVKVTFDKDGPTITGADSEPITLKPGKHGIVVTRRNFTFETDRFVLKKGETVTLKIEFQGGKVQIVKDGTVIASRDLPRQPKLSAEQAWLKKIAALPTEQQVQAVMAKLKDLNPGFNGAEKHVADNAGVVTKLYFNTDNVTEISPVRALTGLETLTCGGSAPGKGQLADLSPLKDLKLTSLSCRDTRVSDLSPLKDMKLTHLSCDGTKVWDLSPLKNMPLTYLHCGGTKITDLSPLRDMKLTDFSCRGTQVSDLSPLKGMPLKEVHCDFWPERDAKILRAIKTLETINGKPAKEVLGAAGKPVDADWLRAVAGMPAEQQVKTVMAKLKDLNPGFDGAQTHVVDQTGVVTELQFLTDNVTNMSPVRALTGLETLTCGGSAAGKGQLADLASLRGMKLTGLHCYSTQIRDLSPLKGMKLTELGCDDTPVSDLTPLAGLPLKKLYIRRTKVSDLKPLENMKLALLWCDGTGVFGLAPLKGMPLTSLGCVNTKVSDLTPLKGMKLTFLNIDRCPNVSDLTPLRGMRLTHLFFYGASRVPDLSVLKGMKLEWLNCHGSLVSDLTPLRGMKLAYLDCGATKVFDLSPLKNMKIAHLSCSHTAVSDLSPLKNMPLAILRIDGTKVTDLSLLRGMPLKELDCDFNRERDAPILRSIRTLETLNGQRAKDLLK
jgi:serine/threonine protein kinase/Leucine-rich repeat (LRR) protein